MRYTRYNYRRNKNRNNNKGSFGFLFLGAICIILAVVVGTLLRPLIFGDAYTNSDKGQNTGITENGDKKDDKKDTNGTISDGKDNEGNKSKTLYMIQCGLYSKKEGAESVLNKIPDSFNKFITKENDKFRVIAGIYDEKTSKSKCEELKNKDIENVRIKSEFKESDKNEVAIFTIVKGLSDILNKLEEKDVKSINIEEFKKFTKEIEGENDNKDILEIKEYINKLPKDLDKKEASKSLDYIYKILIKHRV
ncbi:SPOR domain-containing protein [Clostridium chrysemydis]|uniref:SPOR domain-containing protein n=1 Tax=Clostridium chrysemydis TaxID=2665504 RepID=UPI003F3BBCE8